MDIHDHFRKLYDDTKELNIWYAPAYDIDNGGTMTVIGYRSDDPDPIIDEVVWMIAGESAIDVRSAKPIKKFDDLEKALKAFEETHSNPINIILHAQAIIGCSIVTVHLGTYMVEGSRFSGKNGLKTLKLRRLG